MEDYHDTQPKASVRANNPKALNQPLTVVQAEWIKDYQLTVHFSDSTERVIDFAKAFAQLKGYYAQYRQPALFQAFTIDNGNLVWGEDWDVIFPTRDLYTGKIG